MAVYPSWQSAAVILNSLVFFITLAAMEGVAYLAHKYLMHGWGWGWHLSLIHI